MFENIGKRSLQKKALVLEHVYQGPGDPPEDEECPFTIMHYSHSSLHVPSKKASRKNRMWSTQAGSSLLLFASRMSPAAENRRSTAVDVAGAVKYLYNILLRVFECAFITFLQVQPRQYQQDL